MGLAGFNRMRREKLKQIKLEHDTPETEKSKILEERGNTYKAVEEKSIEVMQDAADAEKRKEKEGGPIDDTETPEETEAKSALVMEDNEAAIKAVEENGGPINDSDTPEDTNRKGEVVFEDAEEAEAAKEENGGPLSDPPVEDPRGDGETDPDKIDNALPPTDPEEATAKAQRPKRSRRKANFDIEP